MKIKLFTIFLLFTLLSNMSWAQDISHIIVLKDKRELQLWQGDKLFKTYDVKLSISYNNPLFRAKAKEREGDNQTPVGFYKISKKRQNTRFPKSLLISYPNWKDKHNARVRGIPLDQIGGMILIHGNPYRPTQAVINFAAKLGIEKDTVDRWARDYFYPFFDWTNGCVAVSDEEMNEIFSLVKKNTPINIYP
ncbi:murein L,D-transpeptidase family protein [Halobacteriovorax sp. HLS]|uniref:L,D-transpeptidase family protein n=1 Tax=Halobacteriovorax sp. HLS TaxID=2234000 RepID=UPI000FDCBAC3|nr:L,D-transpeptidase family protein [Halobacteriovorax sp. HLS]